MPEMHPESIEKQAEPRIDPVDLEAFAGELVNKAKEAETNRSIWLEKMTRNYRKRYGVRPRKKNFPWPGSSNTHIYLSDEKVRRMKPNYLNLAFEGDPIVNFEPIGNTPEFVAQNAEIYMDWLLKYRMTEAPGFNYFESLSLIVDDMIGSNGIGVAKIIYDHQIQHRTRVIDIEDISEDLKPVIQSPLTTDDELKQLMFNLLELDSTDSFDQRQVDKAVTQFREGKTKFKIKERYVSYKGSRVIRVNPKDLIVANDTTHIQTSTLVVHKMFMTLQDLKVAQRSGKYENVDDIAFFTPKATPRDVHSTLESTKDRREGIDSTFRNDSDLVEIWEMYAYFDIDGDGVGEKVVITIEPEVGTILRFIEFPYDHGKWPFVIFQNELNDDRFYSSRSLVEMLDNYQTIVTTQENNKLDRMTLANSIQFKYRAGGVNPANVRYIMGQGIPVKRMDEFEQLQINNLDISYDNEMNRMMGLADKYIGQPDLSFDTLQNPGDRRTASEVNELVSAGRQVFSFDARLFKNSLQRMYDQIFELEMQFSSDETFTKVTGENTVRISVGDLRGNFVIVPNGEFTTLSRVIEEQKAFAILQLALQDDSGAVNKYEAWINYLLKADPKAAKRILSNPEEFQQIQKLRFQQEQQETVKDLAVAGRLE